jgi:hypothetical protein
MNKKQQLLTSLIEKIKKPQVSSAEIIRSLSELETKTKKDCSHYAQQISAIKAGK